MSCSNNITPCGCGSNPCGCGTSSNDVVYQGPDLSCTGVTNCDTLTEVIQTIDGFICSPQMVQNIINNILNNTNLYNQFTSIVNNTVDCQTVWNCIASTTTTSTTLAPTTTTTTTSVAYCYELSAVGKVKFYWIDVNGVAQTITITNNITYVCAELGSVIADGPSDIQGGVTLCTNNSQCVPTTTTTTTPIPTTTTTSSSSTSTSSTTTSTSTTAVPTTTTTSSSSTSTSTSTTTSTTTIPPTTTTTTTIVNFAHGFSEGKTDSNLACAETVVAITLYTSVPTIVFGTFMYTDPGLTTPFIGGVLFYKNISVNNGIRTGGTGQVSNLFSC
jgi:hypothetical protein